MHLTFRGMSPPGSAPTTRRTHRRLGLTVVGMASVVALLATGCGPANHVAVTGAPKCRLTPANSFWRSDVTGLPVHASSAAWKANARINNKGEVQEQLKADFGPGFWEGDRIGIPYNVVPGNQPKVPVVFDLYEDESDPGPYPIKPGSLIEGANNLDDGDRHLLTFDKDNCILYETGNTYPPAVTASGKWEASGGAKWDMKTNAMRPDGWTSSDAAGLPILPGLVRYEEFISPVGIRHAIRVTVPRTASVYNWPASHKAGTGNIANTPPLGAWLRLKPGAYASVDPSMKPILDALKKYGAVIADNGSALFMTGVPDDRWDDPKLKTLGNIKISDFDFVNTTSLKVADHSYASTTAS